MYGWSDPSPSLIFADGQVGAVRLKQVTDDFIVDLQVARTNQVFAVQRKAPHKTMLSRLWENKVHWTCIKLCTRHKCTGTDMSQTGETCQQINRVWSCAFASLLGRTENAQA